MADNGLASFRKRLRDLPEAVRRNIGPDLVAAAEDMAASMRQLAPKDSGDLVASIAITGPGQQTPPYSQPGGSLTVPENAVAITVGNSEVRYAHLVEYGTTRTAPKPYFWPAFRLGRAQAVKRIGQAVKSAVRGEA